VTAAISNAARQPGAQYGPRLDALNFFLADVRDGLGPYLAIYLLTQQRWDEASIGIVMAIGGIAGIIAQTPAGALVDASRARMKLLIAAAVVVTIGSIVLPWQSSFASVAITTALTGAAGSIFAPGIAAITLGIVGPRAFARRIGRNEAWNHGGNAVAAAIAAATAYLFGPVVVFWLMAALAVASIVTAASIPEAAIDVDLARGLSAEDAAAGTQPAGLRTVFAIPGLAVFAAACVLFHFSNAAMLPLVGQKLALANKELGTSLMAICILAAQAVMVPVAMVTGAKADSWGRKPLFLAGFAILALRGFLYPVSDSMAWLVAVQLLDGFGAGIFGALFPIIVSDLTYGTGRFNVSQGAIATAQGVGASLSTAFAGLVIVAAGYSAAFLSLGAIALAGLLLYALAMPETRPKM
jgi:MFS family permease